jgi:hypothetical protein
MAQERTARNRKRDVMPTKALNTRALMRCPETPTSWIRGPEPERGHCLLRRTGLRMACKIEWRNISFVHRNSVAALAKLFRSNNAGVN